MLQLSPKARWNLSRILPFGIIWAVIGLVFVISDTLAIGDNPVPEGHIDPSPRVVVFAVFATFCAGLTVGALEMIYVDRMFRKASLFRTILYKFILYTLLFLFLLVVVYPLAAKIELLTPISDPAIWEKFKSFWGSLAFLSTALQLTFSLLVSLIYAAISENLGHSVLTNFFSGKYHTPKQEERIFLFLDMKDSTTIAESLGHLRYFDFLQRYYYDLANAIIQHEGEVYQYVGDEIVLTWPLDKGIEANKCIRCFFAMKQALLRKADRYNKMFGHIPKFKAGIHLDAVTTGEVGALKKEIVFTGDVLNTAARIQGLCREAKEELLISEEVRDALPEPSSYVFTELDRIYLRGKQFAVTIYGVKEGHPSVKNPGSTQVFQEG